MLVKTIPLAEILVENRARQDVGDTSDIEQTIRTNVGQIQPIAVMQLAVPTAEGHSYRLLAGGRRYEAFSRLEEPQIAAHIYPSELSEEDQLSIELIENIARQDMRWDERCDLIANIHSKFCRKQELANASEPWTQNGTAEVLGLQPAIVSKSLSLYETMKQIPDVRRAKSFHEALNAEARLIEELVLKEKAKRARKNLEATDEKEVPAVAGAAGTKLSKDGTDSARAKRIRTLRKRLLNSYICGDMFEVLKEIPEGEFDLVEFDPDYGIEHLSQAFSGSSSKLMQDIINKNYQAVSNDVATYSFYLDKSIKAVKRVMKPDSWLLMWYSLQDWHNVMVAKLQENGFEFTERPAVWSKDVSHKASLSPDIYLAATYETFIYARLGNAQISDRGRGDVFFAKTIHPQHRIHPTEKPVGLMQQILHTFGKPNNKVLVPHAGSGNTLMAALNLDMIPLGIEISPEMRDKFSLRCESWEPAKSIEELGEK